MDDAAPPNGGAVNHSFRQTDRRDVCAGERGGGGGRSKHDVCDWNPESPLLQKRTKSFI
jgi:hypothetical protein